MHNFLWWLILLLFWVAPAHAFVTHLAPNNGNTGPISCHQMGGVVSEYAVGAVTAQFMADELVRIYLMPHGLSWTAEDNADNSALKTLVDGTTGATAKQLLALRVEHLCAQWEHGFSHVDTKNKYRSLLGLPTQ